MKTFANNARNIRGCNQSGNDVDRCATALTTQATAAVNDAVAADSTHGKLSGKDIQQRLLKLLVPAANGRAGNATGNQKRKRLATQGVTEGNRGAQNTAVEPVSLYEQALEEYKSVQAAQGADHSQEAADKLSMSGIMDLFQGL